MAPALRMNLTLSIHGRQGDPLLKGPCEIFFYLLQKCCPTNPFPILEPQNPLIDEFYVVQNPRTTDFKAPKL